MDKPLRKACELPLVFLIFLAISLTLILASVPPVDRDALTHHLFVPKLYLQHGGIYEIPEIPFSYYPMNLDLLYLVPLAFGNDIVPKYIHFLFGLATAWLIYAFLRHRSGRNWALFGALFFLTIPVIVKLSITVYVDLGLVFFSTAGVLALIGWVDNDFNWKFLALSGLCAGLAAGTKYNGLVSVVVLALLVPLVYSRNFGRNSISQLALAGRALAFTILFLGAVLLTYSPWLVRNYVWTGNPIYPLHDRLFNPPRPDATAEAAGPNAEEEENPASGNIFITRRLVYGETALETLTLPIRFFFQGEDDNPRYFDGRLSPFLLILPLFAFLGWSSRDAPYRRTVFILAAFAFLYFFFTFFQSAMRVRYVSPSLPPLVILSIFGIDNLANRLRRATPAPGIIPAALVLVVAASVLFYNGNYIHGLFQKISPLTYLSGSLSRDEYITRHRPEYPAIQWINERTGPDDCVLCIFLGNRGYYMDFFPVFATPYGSPLPYGRSTSGYVLVRDDLFAGWLAYANRNSIAHELPFPYEKPLFAANGHSVYRIDREN